MYNTHLGMEGSLGNSVSAINVVSCTILTIAQFAILFGELLTD